MAEGQYSKGSRLVTPFRLCDIDPDDHAFVPFVRRRKRAMMNGVRSVRRRGFDMQGVRA
jgi:hypothetical protein